MSLKLEEIKEKDRGIIAPCGIICLGCDTYTGEGLEAAKKLKRIWEGSNIRDSGVVIGLDPEDLNVSLKTLNKYIEANNKGTCPGCFIGGFASEFCSISKCVKAKGYWTCSECEDYNPSAVAPCPKEEPNPIPMNNKAQMTKMICMRYNKDTCKNLKRCREIGYNAFIKEVKEKVENGWRTWQVISDKMVFTNIMKK
jgi:hypothetical protein